MNEATDQDMRAAVERWARARGFTEGMAPWYAMFVEDRIRISRRHPDYKHRAEVGQPLYERTETSPHAALVWALVLEARPLRDGSVGDAPRATAPADLTDVFAQHVLDSQRPCCGCKASGWTRSSHTVGATECWSCGGNGIEPGEAASIEAIHVFADRLQPDLMRRADGPPRDLGREALGLHIAHLLAGSRDGTGEAVEALLRTLPELTCPTCDEAKLGRCCSCDAEITPIEQELAPNPYASDVHGDSSQHLMCDRCAYQSAQDI